MKNQTVLTILMRYLYGAAIAIVPLSQRRSYIANNADKIRVVLPVEV